MRARAIAALLLAGALACGPARASVEEFASLDPAAAEVDDESALDHFLARTPDDWRVAWEAASGGVHTDQGCLTSAYWYQTNEFKTRSAMGRKSWLDVGFLQRTDLEGGWQWFQFDFYRATAHAGEFGWRVRPAYDKSQQDFAALWQGGSAAGPLQARVTFTFEDAFNTFWEFKQAHSGNRSEPYVQHPFEPALAAAWRGRNHRVDVSGTWLTPSRKDINDPDPSRSGTYALWGAKLAARAERTVGANRLIAAFEDVQARSSQTIASSPGDGRFFRRHWAAELGARRDLGPRFVLDGRYRYEGRDVSWQPPLADARFHALDRIGALELDWRAHPDWLVKAGLLYDRVRITHVGDTPGYTYGSRKESRGYFGFQARFDKVQVQVLEGVELDAEPYSVTFHHDKTFLHLQTTF